MSTIKLDYIKQYYDRHHIKRYEFRPPKRAKHCMKIVRLPGKPGSAEFMAAYAKAIAQLNGVPAAVGSARTKPGSMAALIAAFYASSAFTELSEQTQAGYRSYIDAIGREHGDRLVADLEPEHIEKIKAKRASTPAAANKLLRMLRMLMKLAIKMKMRRDDPTFGIGKIKHVGGHQDWGEEGIAAFEARHPLGSKAHLAMALMLYTGCRRGDVVALGPANIRRDSTGKQWLTYTQEKNRRRKPVTLTIPVHSELRRVIEATSTIGLKTFLVTQYGKQYAKGGFSNFMRDRCDEAGLPDCSSHGLRKAIARRLAEAGMTPHEIMAITGHKSIKEVERYCAEARQKLMAQSAMAGLERERTVFVNN
jgi:integrase